MNFRKRINICKGVKMNVSKSGVSFTVGGKAISANLGKNGLFLNTSIPGTGLYDRRRILEFDGIEEKIRDRLTGAKDEKPPKDVALPESQPAIAMPRAQEAPAPQEDEIAFSEIMRLGVDVPDADAYDINAVPEVELCEPEPFPQSAPSLEAIKRRLWAEAESNVQTLAFWNLEKKRDEYVDSHLEVEYQAAYNEWQSQKQLFEAEQARLAKAENDRRLKASQERMDLLRRGIHADADYVEGQIESWLSELELPMEFDVEFEYDRDAGMLMADLDLPEIEDIPDEKTVQLASGQLKTKAKSQKELRQDYVNCVLGLGVFLASHFFCITPDMERVLMSAYTQRRDKKTGDVENVYIYSAIFERRVFEKGGYQDQEPEAFFNRFKSRIVKLASGELKQIEPYGPADVE